MNSKKPKVTNNVVKKTMKDVYTLNRSSLVRAEKPIPKYADSKKLKPVELEDIDEESSTMLINKPVKKNKESKKKILEQLNQKENEEKNANDN